MWMSAPRSFRGGKSEGQGWAGGPAGSQLPPAVPHSPPATDSAELSIHPRSTKPGSHWAGAHVALKHLQTQSEIALAREPRHPQPWGQARRDAHTGKAGFGGQRRQTPIFVQAAWRHTRTSQGI